MAVFVGDVDVAVRVGVVVGVYVGVLVGVAVAVFVGVGRVRWPVRVGVASPCSSLCWSA